MDSACNFCNLSSSSFTTTHANKPYDKILFSTQNFVVIPDRSALVEGWLLVVPQTHVICMGALSAELHQELGEIRDRVSSVLQTLYGPVVAFEHGPSAPNQSVGCTVDHAHLHLVPTSIDLIEGVKTSFPDSLNWESVRGLPEARRYYEAAQPYLYVEQVPGHGRITTHPNFQSQMFRKAIARGIGKPEQSNWREYPQEANVLATIKRLEPMLSTGAIFPAHPMVRKFAA